MQTKPRSSLPTTPNRLIERPRLINLLDAAAAQTILLIAPAGYGKTTLARQWTAARGAKAAWYRGRRESNDVAALATGIADAMATVIPGAGRRMKRRLAGLSNAEHDSACLAELLVRDLENWTSEFWLVLDDYHLAMEAPACEHLVATLATHASLQLLIASRRQPRWVTARQIAYGEFVQLSHEDLAMTDAEARHLLGSHGYEAMARVVACAGGWPAILNLASRISETPVFRRTLTNQLYDFVAEELFQRLPNESQQGLIKIALAPRVTPEVIEIAVGDHANDLLREAVAAGLLTDDHDLIELHPLVRDFIRSRYTTESLSLTQFAEKLVRYFISEERWDEAFAVIEASSSAELLVPLFRYGLTPLMNQGRVVTIRDWLHFARRHRFLSPEIDLAEAELSIRDGQPVRASFFARRAAECKATPAEERSRALYLVALSAHLSDDFDTSISFFEQARDAAATRSDLREALWGLFISTNDLELNRAGEALHQLEQLLDRNDADDVLRRATARFYSACMTNRSLLVVLNELAEARAVMSYAVDPRVISRFVQTYPQCAMLVGRYGEALKLGEQAIETLSHVGVDFVKRYVLTTRAYALAGIGDVDDATDLLMRLEHDARVRDDIYTLANVAIVRARLALASGEPDDAVNVTIGRLTHPVCPGMAGELLATRALAYACLGDSTSADEASRNASSTSRSVETTTLCLASNAITALEIGAVDVEERINTALLHVEKSEHLDGLNAALRAYPRLRSHVSREALVRLSRESDSERFGLREAGRGRAALSRQTELEKPLTSRERQVLDLVARGCSNQQIADELVISVATVKVHIRHIFKKWGVTSRTEAAVRARAT